ncbi:unnamed protein product [Protopolystoma xenopodis]|uniref:Galactosyltransferase C-terminal domain-containing protein n=1 Tax=Protopolystoma xenopodis TaxID=117903 RepID=A0A3S5BA03_9PLAT|nr:unnamed protein product [Protopolystoma xenopodis]
MNILLIRTDRREGLMRARMKAVRAADSSRESPSSRPAPGDEREEALTFLDSHVEVMPGWLEGQLYRLAPRSAPDRSSPARDRLIVSPIIDPIDAHTFHMGQAMQGLEGAFDWRFMFYWRQPAASSNRTDPHDRRVRPYPSPVIAGGIFSLLKRTFLRLGGYDEEMRTWGVENIDLSLRAWLCGGRIEMLPCCRVGHVFRAFHPYTFATGHLEAGPMGTNGGLVNTSEHTSAHDVVEAGQKRLYANSRSSKTMTFLRNAKRLALVHLLHRSSQTQTRASPGRQAADLMHLHLAKFYTALPQAPRLAAGDVSERRRQLHQLACHEFSWFLDAVDPQLGKMAAEMAVTSVAESFAWMDAMAARMDGG